MKKIPIQAWALGVVSIAIIGAVIFALNKPNTASDNNAANSSSKLTASQNDGKSQSQLNQLALPQLSKAVASDESVVLIKTSMGDIKIKLFNTYAPLAVDNFITHAKAGYYNNTIFHRVINNFMIQGGDPKGNGTGGNSIWQGNNSKIDSGSGFKNETSSSLYNIRGALAMANTGQKDSNGSQFFINQNPVDQTGNIDKSAYPSKIYKAYKNGGNPGLDGSYTVFGQVISGMDVVDKIAKSKVDSNDKPKTAIQISEIQVTTEAPLNLPADAQ
ncbi:peptidyl-prolyl cis-trans isomerase A [Weissella oryzae SG25]|uniref:Peptidyl-prolyl cis-trans isomerase n=1 Tax=Weissella oryzae (strain DSM 25784 / JCM 18191 / LMG 30913 / SG25) TaxID=1329250 RepID=A0A069CUJ0_WEIOS|nr:peptidylprolyl isomerase [Weissella oryzae]GAK31470.1 peptidyl-prolyl cis-trans isomerase A [Weissella oryzae SG25]